MSEPLFEFDETYHRVKDIHDEYGGNRYSSIAPCADYPYVFIFYGNSADYHNYDDGFTDDRKFMFIGEGRKGDMTMERGNAAIEAHKRVGNELHIFKIEPHPYQVTYKGEYEYDDHQSIEGVPDENGDVRDIIRFELVPVD